MADDKLAELLKTQKSLTEWLQDIGHQDTDKLRREDNDKRVRLKVLHDSIGLPFDEPVQFPASAIRDNTPDFQTYVAQHGEELCALRLLPKQPDLPKLRMRGKTVRGAVAWFFEQQVDADSYLADFVPHAPDNRWATIFVVNEHGIQGEIIYGGHHQLTQGFHDDATPHVFRYDFTTWAIRPSSDEALAHLQALAEYLHVADPVKQKELHDALGATFTHDYLEGYFETTDSSLGTWFIDYSPTLGKMYADLTVSTAAAGGTALVHGQPGAGGTATGPVRIVDPAQLDQDFPEGGVLVCSVTTPDYVPLMQKAAAIVTDQGGILSHAAIVARELKVPCVVGTGNATTVLKNGQVVTVDAVSGDVFAS
ncbi:MAG TPA: PEP-utilizing enzyme [Candidatus Saccharimonadales bacterium]|nr:PEP-utilizing enzyme [Candidatus Saccharimonadales bacterium]